MTASAPASAAALPRATDRDNPWPGLAPFEEGDCELFKGRDRNVTELVRQVEREDLTLLWSLSGLGKTSLLRAGVFPKLREAGFLPVYVRLRYASASDDPGREEPPPPPLVAQCLSAIGLAAAQWRFEAPSEAPSGSLWEYLRRRKERFWGPRNRLVTPLLVFDQFEELFADERRDASAASAIDTFFSDLSDALTGAPPEWLQQRPSDEGDYLYQPGIVKVVLSFREDFLAKVTAFRPLVRAIHNNYYRLEPLTLKQGEEVILDAGGHLLDDSAPGGRTAICRQIVQRVAPPSKDGSVAVDPALLSLFCRELNEARRAQGKALIDSSIVESGAASQIIPSFYEARMSEVSDATRRFVEDHLVLPSRSRDSVAEETALRAGATRRDLSLLIRKRVVRREESRHGQPRLELTHDVLVEPALSARARRQVEDERLREERERHALAERKLQEDARERQAREIQLLQEKVALNDELARARDRADQEARARRDADAQREALDKARLESEAERLQEKLRERERVVRRRKGQLRIAAVVALAMAVGAAMLYRSGLEYRVLRLSDAANARFEHDPQLSTMLSRRAYDEGKYLGENAASVAGAALVRSVRAASRFVARFEPGSALVLSPDASRFAVIDRIGRGVRVHGGSSFEQTGTAIPASDEKRLTAVHFLCLDGRCEGLLLVYDDFSFERIDDLTKPERRFVGSAPEGAADGYRPQDHAFDPRAGRLLVARAASAYPVEGLESGAFAGPSTRWRLSATDVRAGAWSEVPLGSSTVSSVALSEDGNHFAVVESSGLTTVRRAEDPRYARHSSLRPGVAVRINPQGSHVLAIDNTEASFSVWIVGDNRVWKASFPGKAPFKKARFKPDGAAVAIVQDSGVVQVWDLNKGVALLDAPLPASGLEFSPDSGSLVSWERNEATWSEAGSTGESLRLAGHQTPILSAAIASGWVVTMSESETIVWSRGDADRLLRAANDEGTPVTPPVLALGPDGRSAAWAQGRRLSVSKPSATTREVPSEGTTTTEEVPSEVTSLAYSFDGKTLAVGLRTGAITFRGPVGQGAPLPDVRDRRGPITAIAFSGSGTTLAYVVEPDLETEASPSLPSVNGPTIAVLVDARTGSVLAENAPAGRAVGISVLDDERRYAVAVNPQPPPSYYGASGASAPAPPQASPPFAVFYARPGASAGDRRGVPPRAAFSAFRRSEDVEAPVGRLAAISGDAKLAISSSASTITPWFGDEPQPPITFDQRVRAVAVAPLAPRLAVGGEGGLTRVYFADRLHDPITLQARGSPVAGLVFRRDGDAVACARADGSVTVYPLGLEDIREKAVEIEANRQLTPEERRALQDLAWVDGQPPWGIRLLAMLERMGLR